MNKLKTKIPPPIISLLITILMWTLDAHYPIIKFDFFEYSFLAYLLIFIGALLDIISFLNFRKHKTTVTPMSPQKTSQRVIKGFYRFTRNPMYLGMLFILTGIAILFSSLIAF